LGDLVKYHLRGQDPTFYKEILKEISGRKALKGQPKPRKQPKFLIA